MGLKLAARPSYYSCVCVWVCVFSRFDKLCIGALFGCDSSECVLELELYVISVFVFVFGHTFSVCQSHLLQTSFSQMGSENTRAKATNTLIYWTALIWSNIFFVVVGINAWLLLYACTQRHQFKCHFLSKFTKLTHIYNWNWCENRLQIK